MNKNLFLFAAAAALTFTACSDNDDMTASRDGSLSSNETTAVQFSTYLGGTQTRATSGSTGIQSTTKLKETGNGFGVFAYSTGTTDWTGTSETPNFMYNQKVEWNSTNSFWSYTPVKFWPNEFGTDASKNVDDKQGEGESNNATTTNSNGGKISFFAYAPFVEAASYTDVSTNLKYGTDGAAVVASGVTDGTSITDDGIIGMTFNTYVGEPQIRYGLTNTNYTKDVDLLWGQALKSKYAKADNTEGTITGGYNTNITKQAANETVGFLFKHALAKLGGNTPNNGGDPEVGGNNSKVKVILDLDNGSLNGGTKDGTEITGGAKEDATLVTVKSIEIQDWYSYNKANPTNPYSSVTVNKVRKYGWFNIAKGSWSNYEEADGVERTDDDNYGYSSTIDNSGATGKYALNTDIAEPSGTFTYGNTGWTSPTIKGVTTEAKNAYADVTTENKDSKDEGIVMIPGGPEQQFVVTCEYVVRTGDTHLSNGYSQATQKITNLVTIPANALQSNKVYSLLIHLGLTSVKFSAEVGSWENGTNTDEDGNSTVDPDEKDNKDIWLPSNTISTVTYTAKYVNIAADATSLGLTLGDLGLSSDASSIKLNSSSTTGLTMTDITTITSTDALNVTGISANTTSAAKTYTVVLDVYNSDSKKIQEITINVTQAGVTKTA